MKFSFNSLRVEYIFAFFLSAFAFTLPFSKYALSISMFGMSACIFLKNGNPGIQFHNHIVLLFKEVIRDKLYLWMILYYITTIISGLWSSEFSSLQFFVANYAPLVALPIAFKSQKIIHYKIIHLVLLIGIISVSTQLGLVLHNYYSHFEEFNNLLLQGKSMQTPVSHIRFSLIISLNIMILMYFILQRKILIHRLELWLYIFLIIYLILGLHILSVKSGIAGFYLGAGIILILYFIRTQKIKWIWIIIPSGVILLCGMIYWVPSLNAKFYHLLWQLGQYSRGEYRWFSDLERFQSIEFGIKMIQQNPILGTGIGDIYSSTQKIYSAYLNTTDIRLPHNQFVFSWAFCGIPNFVSLCMICYYSFTRSFASKNILSLGAISMIWFSLMVEYGLGTQIGLCLCVFVLLITDSLYKLEGSHPND
ncbi:MAG: O-antigen ligase family protein [Saprospiraceae bacterium]|nr:O-antigen ligase family protein [Saprospiraceae bacterium]